MVNPPQDDRGVAMIELIMVLAVLAALMATAGLALRGVTSAGDEAACAHHRRVVETAVEAYFAVDDSTSVFETDPDIGIGPAAVIGAVSSRYDIDVDGSLIPSSDSRCT